jgi:RimJ/RimL family protein N-acetyltransferase
MPEIRVLQPGDEAALEAFLLPIVESSMFLLGNMRNAGLLDDGRRYSGSYAAAFAGQEIAGVVAHYWNGNLVLQAPTRVDLLWRAAVTASKRSVRGVIGPGHQVRIVKQALGADLADIQLDEVEKLCSLRLDDLLIPDALGSGRCQGRRIEPRDVDLITEWRVAFSLESLGEEFTPQLYERCRVAVERGVLDGHTWVLEDQGQPVATSSFNTAIAEAVQIGGVWTPPALRRRGYGRSVVAASLLDARSESVQKAILFTGQENVAARRAYEAIGFRSIGDYRMLLLRSAVPWRTEL